jgi:hypothetical protein
MAWMMVAGNTRVGPDGRWNLRKGDGDVEWGWRGAWGGWGDVMVMGQRER